ncbi:hypothetical protein ES705_35039 [subsurface metagenome]
MKTLLIFFLATLLTVPCKITAQSEEKMVDDCVFNAGENTTYLKDYIIKLPKVDSNKEAPVYKATVVLVKTTRYRFTICNSANSEGKGIIQIYDNLRLLGSSYNPQTGKIYNSFDFPCNKTGQYNIQYSFQDGEKGLAVGIISLVK